MLTLSAKAPKPPGNYGKDHVMFKPKGSPMAGTPGGLLAGISRSNMFDAGSVKPTDGATSKQMLDGNRVYNKIVAKVGKNDKSGHFYREHDCLFGWDGQTTIRSEQRSLYHVPTLAVLNDKIRNVQEPRFESSIDEFTGSASSSSSTVYNSLGGVNLMSLKGLHEIISILGLPLHEITPGKAPSIDLARNVGGVSFTINYEGRSEIGNLWGDNTGGSHVGFALNKPAAIDISNPFKCRCHRVEPCTSRTSSGIPWYNRYGIKAYNNHKRARVDDSCYFTQKYCRTSDGKSSSSSSWRSSRFSSTVGSGKYRRNSLIINCTVFNARTTTGTIFSLMRHEKTLANELKEFHSEARKVPNTFLDWSVNRFDVNRSIPTGSQLMQAKNVYSQSMWRIVRHQAAYYKLGVVLTSQRGGEPDAELIDNVVYHDHECMGENMQQLNADNKLTIHVRTQ